MSKSVHPMVKFFAGAPALWALAAIAPGGLLVANTEYAARNESHPRSLPWPAALIFGIGLFAIVMILTAALGGSVLVGYFASKALGLTILSYQAWADRDAIA
jgi:hypothetical protein